MQLAFSKYEGLGNDFIVVDADRAAGLGPAQAISLCDRHLGVGADGVLLVDTRGPRPTMRVINAETQLLYSSDYPHWDFDLPSTIYDLPFLSETAKRNILGDNANKLFNLGLGKQKLAQVA